MQLPTTTIFVVAYIAYKAYQAWQQAGDLSFVKETPRDCQIFHTEHLVGAEDLTFDWQTGLLFVSTDDRFDKTVPGRIFVVDVSGAQTEATALKFVGMPPQNPHPHGISLWRDPNGEKFRLFMVNHRENGHFIDIFDIDLEAKELVLVRSVSDKLLFSPNDVLAIGPESFITTNDNFGPVAAIQELVLKSYGASVLLYDPENGFKTVLEHVPVTNGVQGSVDGTKVYIAYPLNKTIQVFDLVDKSTLRFSHNLVTESYPDNIELDRDTGDIYVGEHVSFTAFWRYLIERKACPSKVTRITNPDSPIAHTVSTVFASQGRHDADNDIGATATGAYHKGKLVLGSVFQRGILICNLEN